MWTHLENPPVLSVSGHLLWARPCTDGWDTDQLPAVKSRLGGDTTGTSDRGDTGHGHGKPCTAKGSSGGSRGGGGGVGGGRQVGLRGLPSPTQLRNDPKGSNHIHHTAGCTG